MVLVVGQAHDTHSQGAKRCYVHSESQAPSLEPESLASSRKRINGNQIGSNFFFVHVKMFHVALQLLQKNLESELYRSYTERVRGVG